MKVPNKSNVLTDFLKPFLPVSIRSFLRRIHQRWVFKRAIGQFKNHYGEMHNYPDLVGELIYGWGNMGWSSLQDYTKAIIDASLKNSGPVVECGSGLSTILLGIIAQSQGFKVYSLEHHSSWHKKVTSHLIDLSIDNVQLMLVPLKDHTDFTWYDVTDANLPADISLVICDGPPHNTKGGRYGLLPILNTAFAFKCKILLDDFARPDERRIVRAWSECFNLIVTTSGENDQYAEIIFEGSKI